LAYALSVKVVWEESKNETNRPSDLSPVAIVLVAFTKPKADTIRIISARRASKRETEWYRGDFRRQAR
jgi:uncharacterized DUF497 family protein